MHNLCSASSSWTTATPKPVTAVIAEAIAGQKVSGRTPPNSREVIVEKRSNCRLSTSALCCMPAIDSDLSSTTARIIPNATKNLGVFQSSPGIIRLGAKRSTSNPRGKTAPQQKNPPAIVSMAGDEREWFRQMNTPDKAKPIPSSAIVPSSKEPRRAALIAHAPASEHKKVMVARNSDTLRLMRKKKPAAPPKQASRHRT